MNLIGNIIWIVFWGYIHLFRIYYRRSDFMLNDHRYPFWAAMF
jgi:hypothetical protein